MRSPRQESNGSLVPSRFSGACSKTTSPLSQQQRFDFSGITDAQFFEQAEGKVVDALRAYAEKAQNGQRLQRRLFS